MCIVNIYTCIVIYVYSKYTHVWIYMLHTYICYIYTCKVIFVLHIFTHIYIYIVIYVYMCVCDYLYIVITRILLFMTKGKWKTCWNSIISWVKKIVIPLNKRIIQKYFPYDGSLIKRITDCSTERHNKR